MAENLFWRTLDQRPWRPVVPLYHPRSLVRIRARKPLPGQRFLPCMGLGDVEQTLDGAGPIEADLPEPAAWWHQPAVVCPNCGGTTFDEDGDCTTCWEPGVAKGTSV